MNLTPTEAKTLSRSRHADVRLLAIQSGLLTRRRLKKLCRVDQEDSVRGAAWEIIENGLTRFEAFILSFSRNAEARLLALQSSRLSRKRLKKLCRKDPDQSVRAEAWELIKHNLTRMEAVSLSRSQHEDVRIFAVQSKLLSIRRVKKLCRIDRDESVRSAAWRPVKNILKKTEIINFSRSRYPDIRAAIAVHPQTPRTVIFAFCHDHDRMVRAKAVLRILENATIDEYQRLIRPPRPKYNYQYNYHNYEDVRLAIAAHYRTPREILDQLTQDGSVGVRREALTQILKDATPAELQKLSTNYDEAARLAVAIHPLAPREVLLKLSIDNATSVREKALPRILENATIAECQTLLQASFIDVKRMVIKKLVENRNPKTTEILLPQLRDPSLQKEVVEAVFNIAGNEAVPGIVKTLGFNPAFRLITEQRLISYFKDEKPQKIAETFYSLQQETKQINIGTRTVEREETSYDPYGSYSSTSTYTTTENESRTFSYFSPEIITKMIRIMKTLEAIERSTVLTMLLAQNAELGRLIQMGSENQDWKKSIVDPVLKSVKEIHDSNFSAASDESIISQLV